MAITDTQQQAAAKAFAKYWEGKGYEKGESQPFWLSLLRDVFGVAEPEKFITFEDQVIHVTMTFGLSESIPGFKIEHLIQQADDKLYSGKKAGKNRVVI